MGFWPQRVFGLKIRAIRCIIEPQCMNVTLLILRGEKYGFRGMVDN